MIVSEKKMAGGEKKNMHNLFFGLVCQLFEKLNLVLTAEQDSEQG